MTVLQFSSSPRSTWLWAPDAETAVRIRGYGRPANRGGAERPLVTDIDISVTAYETCQALAADGYTVTWHDCVHVFNRSGWPADLPGMPAAGPTPAS